MTGDWNNRGRASFLDRCSAALPEICLRDCMLTFRPNVLAKVLVGLDMIKAQYGWSDEELYDRFTFDVQVRYALGYHSLKEGDFDLRSLYCFRHRLAERYLKTGVNLLQTTFLQR
jgi:hypothetical protein